MRNTSVSNNHVVYSLALSLFFISSMICNTPPVHAAGCPAPNFKSAYVQGAGVQPFAFVAADFNHDGKQDMAVADQNFGGAVLIRLGDGNGGFGALTTIPIGLNFVRSIAVGFFNNDSDVDLIVTNFDSAPANQRAKILYGNGMGGFSAPSSFLVGPQPNSVAVGDYNNDGKDDFATANYNNNGAGTVTVRLNDGVGGFSSSTVNVGNGPNSVVAGQFTNDSNLDLIVANGGSSTLTLLSGNG